MTDYDAKRLKYCREQAGYTQQQAAELLFISVESLSRYENGHTPIDGQMILQMRKIYAIPSLGFWYLQNIDPVGREVLAQSTCPIQTNGDLAFQTWLQCDSMTEATTTIKKIMSNNKVNDDEVEEFLSWIDRLKSNVSQSLEMIAYAENLIIHRVNDNQSKKNRERFDTLNQKSVKPA